MRPVVVMEDIIVEAIFLVPQLETASSQVIHGMGNINKMLEELAGDIAVSAIALCKFQGNRQHIQTIHAHPTRTI